MKLHLLIDTCVWLELAKDHRQLPLLDTLLAMTGSDEIVLVLPQIVIDEFVRNRDRVTTSSRASLSQNIKRTRQAVAQYASEDESDAALQVLDEVDHRITTGRAAADQALGLIEKLFFVTKPVPISDVLKARAADRAIAKIAPFHRPINGIGDSIIIETYIDALAKRHGDDVLALVTHNIRDFSQIGGDTRLPHPDLAELFDGVHSRYLTDLRVLLEEYASDLISDFTFDREYGQEPRTRREPLEAESKLETQIWYGRKCKIISAVGNNKKRIVSREVWEAEQPEEREGMIVDEIWNGMIAEMKSAENKYPNELGPCTDFEWGILIGKLSALRWVLGDEWHVLDT